MDRNSIKNIFKFLSLVGLIVIAFFTLPLIVGIVYKENVTKYALFLIISLIKIYDFKTVGVLFCFNTC